MLSGRSPRNCGLTYVIIPGSPSGLDDSIQTLPQVLEKEGWINYMVGKWHLGNYYLIIIIIVIITVVITIVIITVIITIVIITVIITIVIITMIIIVIVIIIIIIIITIIRSFS